MVSINDFSELTQDLENQKNKNNSSLFQEVFEDFKKRVLEIIGKNEKVSNSKSYGEVISTLNSEEKEKVENSIILDLTLGRLNKILKNYNEATRYLENIVISITDNEFRAEIYYELGLMYQELGYIEDAYSCFVNGEGQTENNELLAKIHYEIGFYFRYEGKSKEAIKFFEMAYEETSNEKFKNTIKEAIEDN